MNTCFIIQPFDKGKFDKRCRGTFEPAIEDAKLQPYRVDKDPAAVIPIEEIHRGIEDATICLADITTDNPNVWYELGYAIALHKEVVLVCSKERVGKFPFDVQHRTIIHYETDSGLDFDQLRTNITESIIARLEKAKSLDAINSVQSISKTAGLEPYELTALVLVGQSSEGYISATGLKYDMQRAGFTDIFTMIAANLLKKKQFILEVDNHDMSGPFTAYEITTLGVEWLLENRDKLTMYRSSTVDLDDI